jgi:hypothetical protein
MAVTAARNRMMFMDFLPTLFSKIPFTGREIALRPAAMLSFCNRPMELRMMRA